MSTKKSRHRDSKRSKRSITYIDEPPDAQSIFASTPFKFIVNGNPFYIHAALISYNSKPLGRMIDGPMAEAQKGFAVINDVTEDTFARFIQWAYKGYFDAAEFEPDLPPQELNHSESSEIRDVHEDLVESLEFRPQRSRSDSAPEPEVGDDWTWHTTRAAVPPKSPDSEHRDSFGNVKPSSAEEKVSGYEHPSASAETGLRHDLRETFIKRKEELHEHSLCRSQPRGNQSSKENYTKVFLSYAHLYVFADKYCIRRLKTLALQELQAVLKIFTLYLERTGDIIELLRYVYDNTSESKDSVEDMRDLLTHYVGCEMDTLMKDDNFRPLMIEDGGDLLGDFMKMVAKRIC